LAKNLVIVESPAKSKTIGKILGRNYKVIASVGHVRDLPKSKLGIDIENNFEPNYINIRGKGPIINELKKEAKKADKVYLATDPDREGEAISWHLSYLLNIDENEKMRIEFNEITPNAIKTAIKKPRKLNQNIVDAQQARRVLDRLVGYKISPLLWKKIKKGLSAGRVQSVAVKLICDREEEINNFISKEYWTIKALLSMNGKEFEAAFVGKIVEEKEEKIEMNNEVESMAILDALGKESFIIKDIKSGKRKRKPYAPYTTSTLQQDASKKLGFNTKKTMIIAQQLYEGIDLKTEGTTGLVSYIRTDSTRISTEAMEMAKEYILENYGKEYSNGGNNYGKKTKKETQDAHEAIRPTNVMRTPEKIKEYLSKDQFKLYKLIWDRFMGSQMTEAKYDTLSIIIDNNGYIFKANGNKLIFPGFLKVYITADEEIRDMNLPNLEIGDILNLENLLPKQNFTQPSARYTEASLIKTLEELGIGRPSTFAPTISTIQARNYVTIETKSFYPTELGLLVNDVLLEYFDSIINEDFTANLEDKLDDVAEGDLDWKKVIGDFYGEFDKLLKIAEEKVDKIEIKEEVSDILCEKCGRNMVIKTGRFGKFLACPGYPECKNTKALLDELDVKCPECADGKVVRKRSKKGRVFYGCSTYPDCKFVSWDEPLDEKCPVCNSYMTIKRNRKNEVIKCSSKECGFVKKD